jgi:DNA replication protein DnaC
MSATTYEHLAKEALQSLGHSTAADLLDSTAQRAAAEDWSYSHFLGLLLEHELVARKRRQVETNLRFANLPYHKRLNDFDFSFQPSIDRTLIEELSTGRFLEEGRNIVLLGPPGVGKLIWPSAWACLRPNSVTVSTLSAHFSWLGSWLSPSLRITSLTPCAS